MICKDLHINIPRSFEILNDHPRDSLFIPCKCVNEHFKTPEKTSKTLRYLPLFSTLAARIKNLHFTHIDRIQTF
jgi:hypothetical protein